MMMATTMIVQCVGTVNVPRCQGAFVVLSGVKVSCDVPFKSVPKPKTKSVNEPERRHDDRDHTRPAVLRGRRGARG